MEYRLLSEFRALFAGQRYLHRNSSQGDRVAIQLYEDLLALGRDDLLHRRLHSGERVVNTLNKRRGIKARRGDGTLGEPLPRDRPRKVTGLEVMQGEVATIEIGVEVKILAKAMIKQIDRVISDLNKQAAEFRSGGGDPLCVAIVGINTADKCTSYEGDRVYVTDGKKNKHPIQEAEEAERRIVGSVKTNYDALLILRFYATNAEPFDFRWHSETGTVRDYGAELVRLSNEYSKRFGGGSSQLSGGAGQASEAKPHDTVRSAHIFQAVQQVMQNPALAGLGITVVHLEPDDHGMSAVATSECGEIRFAVEAVDWSRTSESATSLAGTLGRGLVTEYLKRVSSRNSDNG